MNRRLVLAAVVCSSVASAQAPGRADEQDSVHTVLDWVRKNAIPFDVRPTVTSSTVALRPLGDLVGNAHLVGLGEGTHGTREFYIIKSRLIRYFIEAKGFRTIAFEGNYDAVQSLDDYVLLGKGTPEGALAALNGFNWETDELVALLRWIRAYNLESRHQQKIRFVGVDVLNFYPSLAAALKYVSVSDSAAAARLARPFVNLLHLDVSGSRARQGRFDDLGPNLSVDDVELLVAATDQVRDYLDRHRPTASGTVQWTVARQHAAVALQRARVVRTVRGWYTSSGPAINALYGRASQDVASLQEFLEIVNPAFADTVRPFLTDLSRPSGARTQYVRSMSPEQRGRYEALASQLIAQVDVQRATNPSALTGAKWDSLADQARSMRSLVHDFREYLSRATVSTNEPRDPSLAENVMWALREAGPDAKVIVWAHNIHIQASPYAPGSETMGSSLRKSLGKDYVTIGTVFNRGGFQARILPVPADTVTLIKSFNVAPASAGSVEAVLAQARIPAFAIDLRSVPPGGLVEAWFTSSRPMRNIGNGYNEAKGQDFYHSARAKVDFDVLIFLDSTSRAQSLTTARQKYRIGNDVERIP